MASSERQTATLAPTITLPSSGNETPVVPSPTPPPTSTLPPPDRLEAALAAVRTGEWEQALALLASLRDDPTRGVEALFHLGDLFLSDGQPVQAVAAWQQALERDPEGVLSAPLRYRLALRLAESGQQEEALALWRRVDDQIDEVDHVLAVRMASAYRALGQGAAAREEWERAYEFPSADRVTRAQVAFQIASWHEARSEWDEALLWFERALELSEIHEFRAQIVARLADAAAGAGNRAAARRHWRLLVTSYDDTPEALRAASELEGLGEPLPPEEVAAIYLRNEQWTEALRLLYSLMEGAEATHDADLHAQAARALEAQANWDTARLEWEKIIETHPEARALFDDALLGIGRAERNLGRPVLALRSWERVLDEFPEGDAAPDAFWSRVQVLRAEELPPGELAPLYEQFAARYPEAEQASRSLWEAGLLWYTEGEMEKAMEAWKELARRRDERRVQALYWAGKVAAQVSNERAARPYWELALYQEPTNYYALRAAARLAGDQWAARGESDYAAPPYDMGWLAEAVGQETIQVDALPDNVRFRQGEVLLRLGERERALDAFSQAISSEEAPLQLWSMAKRLASLGVPRHSVLAATTLMEQLGYDALSAPLPLAALAFPLPYDALLRDVAGQHGLDPLFLAALIHQESVWEPRARSHANARGLTQVIPDTGQWIASRLGDTTYEFRKLDRPVTSLRYGSYYLDYVLEQFDDNPFHALAAYNAGPGNAQLWLTTDEDLFVERISSAETYAYVTRIYKHWWAYERIYRGGE